MYKLVPEVTTKNQVITFFLKVKAKGGSALIIGPLYLVIGCVDDLIDAKFLAHPSLKTLINVPAGNIGKLKFQLPLMTESKFAYCQVSNVSVVKNMTITYKNKDNTYTTYTDMTDAIYVN